MAAAAAADNFSVLLNGWMGVVKTLVARDSLIGQRACYGISKTPKTTSTTRDPCLAGGVIHGEIEPWQISGKSCLLMTIFMLKHHLG